ncbi:MAG TPA: hypothetical protein VGG12_03950 [Methylovirgula sp.]|jgi:hypothetical protein
MGINHFLFPATPISRVLLIGAFTLAASSAVAFEPTQEQREACTPDAFRLCSNEIPDIPRVTACMEANKNNLSPACRVVFDAGTQQSRTAQADAPVRHPKRHRYSRYWHHREASLR